MKRSFIILIFVSLFIFVEKELESAIFPITNVQIMTPLHYVSSEEVKKNVMPLLGGFFSTNMSLLKTKLSKVPFVDEVNIRRKWPHSLQIALTEQQLVAIWNDHEAVNSKGDIVTINTKHQHLPTFSGPRNQSSQMLSMYKQISNDLSPRKLSITQLDLNDRGSWQVLLNNQYKVILGRKDIANRFLRFIQLWNKLPKGDTTDTFVFDLRYPNGFAMSSFSHKIDKNNRAF